MDLSIHDTEDLTSRARTVLDRLDVLFREIGPKVAEIGKLREEYALIADELEKRGVLTEEKKDGQ